MKLSVFLHVAGIVVLIGCGHKANKVVYVFPDTFRGEFRLTANDTNGVSIVFSNGTSVINVPANGKLAIKQSLPNVQWHTPYARTMSGRVIPVYGSPAPVSNDVIALRCIGNVTSNEAIFVLGTYSDAARAIENAQGFAWPSKK